MCAKTGFKHVLLSQGPFGLQCPPLSKDGPPSRSGCFTKRRSNYIQKPGALFDVILCQVESRDPQQLMLQDDFCICWTLPDSTFASSLVGQCQVTAHGLTLLPSQSAPAQRAMRKESALQKIRTRKVCYEHRHTLPKLGRRGQGEVGCRCFARCCCTRFSSLQTHQPFPDLGAALAALAASRNREK